jgi:hypothetical protein
MGIDMTDTTFRFTRGTKGMAVAASYDTGWNEGLQCGGAGGWTDEVALNDDDAAVFRMRNMKTGNRISVCGMRYWRGMTFSAVVLTDSVEGFDITEDADGITVVCKGGSSIEYTPAVPAPKTPAEADAQAAQGKQGLTVRIPGATV